MAEAIGVIYAALTIIQVADSTFKLFRQIQNADIRMDTLLARLVAEKAASIAWRQQILIANGRTTVPPDQLATVQLLVEKLKHYHTRAESLFQRLGDGRGVTRSVFVRKAFAAGGYARLKDLVDAIKAINDALQAIAPPLPPYSRFVYDHEGHATIHTAEPQVVHTTRDTTSERESPLDTSGDTHDEVTVTERNPVSDILSTPLADIYHLAMEALLTLSADNPAMEHIAARLKLWGAGLFSEPIPLDTICSVHTSTWEERDLLARAILQAMAYILVLEEKLLLVEANLRDDDQSEHLLALRMRISAQLGTNILIDDALKVVAMYLDTETDFEPAAAAKREEPPESFDPWDTFDDAFKAAIEMTHFVEDLFDLLPAVREQQRYYCYVHQARLEEAKNSTAVATVKASTSIEQGVSQLTEPPSERAVLQKRLVQLETVVNDHDRSDNVGPKWHPTWEKIRDQLEERLSPSEAQERIKDLKIIKTRQRQQEDTAKAYAQTFGDWLSTLEQKPLTRGSASEAAKPLRDTSLNRDLSDKKFLSSEQYASGTNDEPMLDLQRMIDQRVK